MATLEDAAEDLVVKLRGLDEEIAESDRKLETLRERMETARREVDEDWADLTESVESFLGKVHDEEEELDRQGEATLQAVVDAHNALGENATSATEEMGQAAADLDALGQQAEALAPQVGTLVTEGVETPAQALEDRVKELETELGQLVDEARDFLVQDVVPGIEQVAEDVRERCEELHRALTEDRTQPLQEVFDEWAGRIDEVESYVMQQGYDASHQHALDVVEYALDECETRSRQRVEELTQVVSLLEGQLRQLATEVERSGDDLTQRSGARLLRELDEAKEAAERALGGLDRVRQELAARSFMD
jgi:DNA-binding ferritin-like protein